MDELRTGAAPRDAAPPLAVSASVVITVRNRARFLGETLDALLAQGLGGGSFEVLAFDDGSSDGTRALLDEAAARDPRLRVLGSERSIGPGLARNQAAHVARGEALVFLDSDCVALDGWLDALLTALGRPGVGAVGGAEVPDPAEPLFSRAVDFVLTSFWTTGGIRGRAGLTVARYRPRTFSLAIRREVFEGLGGFSGLRNGEDIDLSERVARLGLDLVYAPEAHVHHRRRRTPWRFARQVFAMGRSRATLLREGRAPFEPLYLAPLMGVVAVLAPPVIGIVFPRALALLQPLAWLAGTHLAVIAVAAVAALRDPRAALLGPATFLVQVAGYAIGFAVGLVRRIRPEPR